MCFSYLIVGFLEKKTWKKRCYDYDYVAILGLVNFVMTCITWCVYQLYINNNL